MDLLLRSVNRGTHPITAAALLNNVQRMSSDVAQDLRTSLIFRPVSAAC
jgi:hypothetical protein